MSYNLDIRHFFFFKISEIKLIERQKIIMESDPAYEFNLQLKQVSPMIYEVVHDIDRFNQLEEIKVLLQKIVDSHENLVTTSVIAQPPLRYNWRWG